MKNQNHISKKFCNITSDNGTEIKNKDVEGYLETKDIKFIMKDLIIQKDKVLLKHFTKLFKTIFQIITKMIRLTVLNKT